MSLFKIHFKTSLLFHHVAKIAFVFPIVLVGMSPASLSWGQTDDEDSYFNYDSIVKGLSSSQLRHRESDSDPLANVQIHGGVGLVTSLLSLKNSKGTKLSGFQNGVEASLGIDLFSLHWMAEGSIRRYSDAEIDRTVSTTLQEFDLSLIYRTPLTQSVKLHFGFGLAARFLELKTRLANQVEIEEYSTPSSILSLSVDSPITRELSFGAGLSYRSAMVTDSADRSAVDASLKVGAHF